MAVELLWTELLRLLVLDQYFSVLSISGREAIFEELEFACAEDLIHRRAKYDPLHRSREPTSRLSIVG